MFEVHSQPFVCLSAISFTYCQPLGNLPDTCLFPKLFPDFWLWNDTKNEETITYEIAQTNAWEIQNKLTATDWKKKFHPVGFFIDFGFVSALEEWAGSGSAGSPLTRGLFRHLVNNTDTPEVTCERKKIMSEPRTSFSRRLSSVRLLFNTASNVLNGNDRFEKWHRPL